jgi:UDP-N-acetylmuramate-alanine ligase
MEKLLQGFRTYFTEVEQMTAFIGGIVENNSNLIGSGKTVTVEADEFDRSFCIYPILRA